MAPTGGQARTAKELDPEDGERFAGEDGAENARVIENDAQLHELQTLLRAAGLGCNIEVGFSVHFARKWRQPLGLFWG